MLTKESLADSVVLNKTTVCGANVRAATAFHTKHYLIFLKDRDLLILILAFKRFSEGDRREI